MAVADVAQDPNEGRRRRDVAALAQDRLDHHGGDLLRVDRRVEELAQVAEGDLDRARLVAAEVAIDRRELAQVDPGRSGS